MLQIRFEEINFIGGVAASPCMWCSEKIEDHAIVFHVYNESLDFQLEILFCSAEHFEEWEYKYNLECTMETIHTFCQRALKSEAADEFQSVGMEFPDLMADMLVDCRTEK